MKDEEETNIATFIIAAIIMALVIYIVVRQIIKYKNGDVGCSGCCGGCAKAKTCGSQIDAKSKVNKDN